MSGFGLGRSEAQTVPPVAPDETIQLSSRTYVVAESESALPIGLPAQPLSYLGAAITVARFGNLDGISLVDLVITNGTAMNGTHFTAPGGGAEAVTNTVTFQPFQVSATVLVGITDDQATNDDRNFRAFLQNPRPGPGRDPNVTVGFAATAAVTNAVVNILDEDEGVNFERRNFRVSEEEGVILVSVFIKKDGQRIEGANGVTVDFRTTSDPADFASSAGSDYASDTDFTQSQGTLVFGAGVDERVISIPITQDSEVEFNEDFAIILENLQAEITVTEETVTIDPLTEVEVVTTTEYQTNYTTMGRVSMAIVTIVDVLGPGKQPAGAGSLEWNTNSVFNPTPGANNVVYALAEQEDGMVLVGGDFTAVNATLRSRIARVTSTGQIDLSFDPGRGADAFISGIAIASTNEIYIVGGFNSYNGVQRNSIARITSTGALDTGFNPGSGANGPIYAVFIDSDGGVVVAGDFTMFNGVPRNRFARISSTGLLDLTFDAGAGPNGPIYSIAGQLPPLLLFLDTNDNQFPAEAGYLLPVGTNAGQIELFYEFLDTPDSLAIYRGGVKIFDTGITNTIQVTTNADSTMTTNFVVETATISYPADSSDLIEVIVNEGSTAPLATWAWALLAMPVIEEGIIVGGEFSAWGGVEQNNVARVRPNGQLDANFAPRSGTDGAVYAVALQDDGKVLLGGSFSTVNGESSPGIARLLPGSGGIDPTFRPGKGMDDVVYDIAVQSDGKILAGGAFRLVNGTRRSAVVRLLDNGWVDTTFLDTAFNSFAGIVDPGGFVNAVLPQEATGSVLIGGMFTRLGGGAAQNATLVQYNLAQLVGGETTGPGNVRFGLPEYSYDEHAPSATVEVVRENGTVGNIEVQLQTRNGLALATEDYEIPTNERITLPDGIPDPQPFSLALVDDAIEEGNEDFEIEIMSLTGQMILGGVVFPTEPALGDALTRVLIIDNEFPSGEVGFSSAEYMVNENGGNALITIIRTNGTAGRITIDYAAVGGPPPTGATEGADFTRRTGSIVLQPGISSATFNVPILDDPFVENDEIVLLTLSNVRGGATLGLSSSTLVIVDNDFAFGRASLTASDFTVREDRGLAELTVQRTGGNVGVLTVEYESFESGGDSATVPGDYTDVRGVLQWNAGDISVKRIFVPISNDGLVEGDETFSVRLFNPSPAGALGLRTSATVTILDDDAFGELAFNSPVYLANENGGSATVIVTRRAGSAESVSISYATEPGSGEPGVDYLHVSGTLSFGPGETSKSFAVPILDDDVADGEKTVRVVLSSPVLAVLGMPSEAEIQILDDESLNIPAGSLDSSFRVGAGFNRAVYTLGLQQDGRLVVGGEFTKFDQADRLQLARLTVNGTLDPTFTARTDTNGAVRALLVQSDGRILIGGGFTLVNGQPANRVARLTSSGAFDITFNPGAAADSAVSALAETFVDGQRKILAGGSFNTFNGQPRRNIVRLNNDGSIDGKFNPGSGPNGAVLAIQVLHTGKILIAGDFSMVSGQPRVNIARLNADGSLDLSFNAGLAIDGPIRALAVQSDDRILIGGQFRMAGGVSRNRIARLLSDGTLDTTFDTGAGADASVLALALEPDGNILVGGDFTSFNGIPQRHVVRLTPSGAIDTTINFGLGPDGFVGAILRQPDQKIVLGGAFNTFDGVVQGKVTRLYGGSLAGAGAFEFSRSVFAVSETVGDAVITVRRTGGLTGAVSVQFSTAESTALAGVDYTDVSGILNFRAGESSQTFIVPVIDDLQAESDEQVLLVLSDPAGGARLGAQPVAVLNILSDDSVIGFSEASYSVIENLPGQTAIVTVRRTGSSVGTIAVNYSVTSGTATAGQDFVSGSGQLVFGPGEEIRTFTVRITDDSLVEENETITLRLLNPTGGGVLGLANATLTIVDNDFAPGVLRFSTPAITVPEGGHSATVVVVRNSGSAGVVTINYSSLSLGATPGSDYTPVSGTLSFGDGEISKAINIPILDDELIEGNEAFAIQLATVTGGAALGTPSTITVTIIDDDLGPGSLDQTFTPANPNAFIYRIAIQPDEKIVASGAFTSLGGISSPGIGRLLPTGARDASFVSPLSAAGVWTFDIRPDGRIWIGGDYQFPSGRTDASRKVALLRTNGLVETSFFVPAGLINGNILALDGQPDGKVVAGGDFTTPASRILRLNANGTHDVSFNPDSGANGDIYAVVRQPDGKILLGGAFDRVAGMRRGGVVRLLGTGLLDPAFMATTNSTTAVGTDGIVSAIELLPDGKILIAGDFSFVNGVGRENVARLNSDGSLDTTFVPGSGPNGAISDLALQFDGKVVVAGSFTTFNGVPRVRVARLESNGQLDPVFDPGPGPDGIVYSVAVQRDGKVLIAGDFSSVNGFFTPGIARLNGDDFVPPTEVEIQSVSISSGGQLTLVFTSEPGRLYQIETSSDLSSWEIIATRVASDVTVEFTDPEPAVADQRFYRIQVIGQ